MIVCPRCGHENADDAVNCAGCRINLRYALENREEVKRQWQDQQQSAMLVEKAKGLLVTTTPTVEGQIISSYLGVVSSVVVLGRGPILELGTSVADLFGTRASGFENKLSQAQDAALQELREQAVQLGGDAIVGAAVDYMTLPQDTVLVSVHGTAVKLLSQSASSTVQA